MSSTQRHTTPRLAFCGVTGSGKSSLVNALVKAQVQRVGPTPTTREPAGYQTETASGVLVSLLDTPGIGEAGADGAYPWAVGQVAKEILEAGDDFDTDSFKKTVRRLYEQRKKNG